MPAINKPQSENKDKFWNFIPGTENTPPELLLYGAISSQQSWWEDRVTPATFNKELADLGDVPEIVVRINSGGGDVFAANAIFTRLKDHSAHVTVKIDGWAASAATIIAMAGDTIKIARNGVFMIHDPSMTVWDNFTADDFKKMAEELDVIKQSIVNTYAMKTGKETSEIENLMSDETWWTGADAVANGFCDALLFEDSNTIIENSNRIVVNSIPIDVSSFKTLPKQLLNSPHNPGNLINKNKPDKEEKNMAENNNSTIQTVDALKAAYPELCEQIAQASADNERARIKAIDDMAIDGYESIVEDAKYTEPISAAETAMKILNEQKKQGKKFLDEREEDVRDSGANGVPGVADEHMDDANPFDKAIAGLDTFFGRNV